MSKKKDYSSEIHDKAEDLWEVINRERQAKIDERFETLKYLYKTFVSMLPVSLQSCVYLSESIAKNAVSSYFDSIYRYKIYSLAERADRHKQSAYMFKWLIKTRPIQIKPLEHGCPSGVSWVNSYYAVHVALAFLLQDCKEINLTSEIASQPEGENELAAVYETLAYQAQYRDVTENGLITQFYLVERLLLRSGHISKSENNSSLK